MVKDRPRWMIFAGAGAVVVLLAYLLVPADAPGPTAQVQAGERGKPGAAVSPLPVIDFARIANPAPAPGLGTRDLFDFAAPPPEPIPSPPPETPEEKAAREAPPPVTVPTPPPLPPLNIKYIGAVERRGAKVAMFITERSEVLTGQTGEVVGNRFRIVKIGLESVDVQQVGSEQVQRIPLKGN